MNIRDAIGTDLPAIVAIYNASVPSQTVTADLEPITVESRMDWFWKHSPDRRPLWVLEKEGTIAGWLGMQTFYGRPAYNATVEISLYISPDFQRQGIGSTLLQYAIAQSPSLGVTTLLAIVFAINVPSVTLLKRFDFKQWGYLPNVVRFGEREGDVMILGRRV
jgi:L-amino acid N-acyltransferase YncA